MTDEVSIKVEDISKTYLVYNKPIDRLKQGIFRGKRKYYREFNAVNSINFEVKKGEILGIVGRNGSGKSTLLQMVCGTLTPTTGKVTTNGRISALLELGSGFNPEFSGHENIYLNASILGLTKAEIDAKYSGIVEFASIGGHIEQPVKNLFKRHVCKTCFLSGDCNESRHSCG